MNRSWFIRFVGEQCSVHDVTSLINADRVNTFKKNCSCAYVLLANKLTNLFAFLTHAGLWTLCNVSRYLII